MTESDEHMQLVDEPLSSFSDDDFSKCNLFTLTLRGTTQLWFNGLPDRCIDSWAEFHKRFLVQFPTQKKRLIIEDTLIGMIQRNKEILWSVIDWFMKVSIELDGA